jgi:hypothetical protein
MNLNLDKLLAGWTFRTSTPVYDVGDELIAFVTSSNGKTPIVRVGDTVISLPGANENKSLVDKRVRIRVTEFDPRSHEGAAELLQVFEDDE